MTEPKKKNMSGPLDEYTAAARIARLVSGSAAALLDVEKTVRAAVEKKRHAIQEEIRSITARVPKEKQERIAALVLAGGSDLCGFDLYAAANETAANPDAIPPALREPVPPATGRIEVNREAPMVGARRQ
jgi:hypothetical protein